MHKSALLLTIGLFITVFGKAAEPVTVTQPTREIDAKAGTQSGEAVSPQPIGKCHANIQGKEVVLTLHTDDSEYDEYIENTTLREILFRGWNGECPGFIVLKHLTPKSTAQQRTLFCVNFDEEKEFYSGFATGERDAYGVCKKPGQFCKVVNATKQEALAVTGVAAGLAGGATTAAGAAGVTAVVHSSGAVILTGGAGYIAGTLGTVGAATVGVLTAPVTLAAAGVSLVAVGTAVYVCD